MKTEKSLNQAEKQTAPRLIPGSFSKCYYCDVDNQLCRKYNQPKNGWNEIGDWTWENYCLKNGGCDR